MKKPSQLGLWLYSQSLYNAFKSRSRTILTADDNSFPCIDHKGNPLANIGLVDIRDFFSSTRNVLTQEGIMQNHCIGDPLLLVPDPKDNKEVHIITTQGKRLGYLPDEGIFTDMVRRRLADKYDVFAQIFQYSNLHNGRLRCEVRIVYYTTPYDQGVN